MKKINFKKVKKEKINKLKEKFKKKEKSKPIISAKIKKEKKRNKKLRIGYYLLVFITITAIFLFIGAVGFCYYIYKSAPEFNPSQLYEKEASLIYDADNNLIATLGTEKREKITYDELPEVLVDAIIATEDSRFFQHNGFDFPRFLKASIGQVLGNSSAGGASTLTMQVSKNSFTSTEASGVAGIIRKFTDIYLSIFKIEKNYTKEQIIEFYANSPYLGGGAYGVEQASQTYFGKSVKNLSLAEAALIAGLFQAPGSYDPYIYPEKAEGRRNQVLNLMVRHGYISEEIAQLTKQIPVKSLLVSDSYNSINKYQGFIDTVVQAVIDDTGDNPYNVPMIIYSTMKASKQDVINDLYAEKLGYEFKDDKIQVGAALIDNDTGAILAVGAGRNKTKEMTFNYATMTNAHPGSTAKPIFEYGPGIEYYKWSTYTPFFDEKNEIKYSSGQVIHNHNTSYLGLITLKQCLVQSKNTCALQAFQQLDNSLVYDFVTSIGITPESTNGYVGEAHSVGGFTGVSPVELAGAYQIFANGGYYTKPYSYTKIIYRETEEEIEKTITKTKIISPQTAYLISNVLMGVTPSVASVSGTNVATKTGTSSYDNSILRKYKINVIRDSWVATYSPDYTLTFWYGYDALDDEHYACKCYNTMGSASDNRRRIQGVLTKRLFEKNSKFSRPGNIKSATIELGTIPAQLASEFTPSSLKQTHLFISGSEPTETSSRFSKLLAPSNLNLNEVANTVHLTWDSPGLPSAVDNIYLENYFNSGYGKFAEKYYNQRLEYNKTSIGNFGFDIYLIDGSTSKYIGWTQDTEYTIDLSSYPGIWDSVAVRSSYSIFKSNASERISNHLSTYVEPVRIEISMNNIILSVNQKWTGATKSNINQIKINDAAITEYDATLEISNIKTERQEVALGVMLSTPGDYVVTYLVTFSYTDASGTVKKYTNTASQNVKIQ